MVVAPVPAAGGAVGQVASLPVATSTALPAAAQVRTDATCLAEVPRLVIRDMMVPQTVESCWSPRCDNEPSYVDWQVAQTWPRVSFLRDFYSFEKYLEVFLRNDAITC